MRKTILNPSNEKQRLLDVKQSGSNLDETPSKNFTMVPVY